MYEIWNPNENKKGSIKFCCHGHKIYLLSMLNAVSSLPGDIRCNKLHNAKLLLSAELDIVFGRRSSVQWLMNTFPQFKKTIHADRKKCTNPKMKCLLLYKAVLTLHRHLKRINWINTCSLSKSVTRECNIDIAPVHERNRKWNLLNKP